MKVRKLLRDNINAVMQITIHDGDTIYSLFSQNPVLEGYMDRKVKYWTADGTADMCMPGMSIYLEEVKHG